jgi:hypothetical protein
MEVAPPPEGYSKKSLDALVDALNAALAAVAKALKSKEKPPELPEVPKEAVQDGRVNVAIPAAYVEAIANLLMMARQVGGSVEGRYDLDVESLLGSDEGIDKLAVALELVARDKMLLARVKDTVAAEGKAAPPAKSKGKEMESKQAAAPPPVTAPPGTGPAMGEEMPSMGSYM